MTLISQETSRAVVTVYLNRTASQAAKQPRGTHVSDDKLTFTGQHPLGFNAPDDMAIIAVQTSKMMGECSGVWRVQVKSSIDLTGVIQENDWVDISFSRHDKSWHTMRGPVDAVHRERRFAGRGMSTTYTISGRDHGKILETQQVWYDQILNLNAAPVAATRIAALHGDFINANPAEAVRIFTQAHLSPNINNAVGYWLMPNMPGVSAQRSFVNNLHIERGEYSDVPSRHLGLIPTLWSLEAPNVWALAKHFADEELNEVYVDLAAARPTQKNGRYLTSAPYTPDDTVMAMFIRDRPWPSFGIRGPGPRSASEANEVLLGNDPYFIRIPQYDVSVQEIVEDRLAVSGLARVNAFFYTPELAQDLAPSLANMALPLVDIDSIRQHGMRRKNVESIYFNFRELGFIGMIEGYRSVACDMHSMNHLLLTGTMRLKPGRPDIRIGGRVRVFPLAAGFSALWDESYYVEGVTHSWSYQDGVDTSLVLTRGWRGDDDTLRNTLADTHKKFKVLSVRDYLQLTPGEESVIAANTRLA